MTPPNRPCELCHIGTLRPTYATYTTWWQGQLLVVPDLDAWLCDVCGEFFHDPDTVAGIELLLGIKQQATAMSQSERRRRARSSMMLSTSSRRRSA